MENLDLIKLYCFLSFVIVLLLWKFWKDFEFKNKYFTAVDKFNENQNTLLKEVEALSIEITDNSKKIETFTDGLLEYPQYTKPNEFKGMKIPDVLLSGNHKEIKKWRSKKAMYYTKKIMKKNKKNDS